MWGREAPRRILAYTRPTDMRKSFQGLLALVQQVFREQDPYSGSLFLFVNRRDPDVPIDTNHLERTLRVIPMGRKSWLFCWSELGAHQVGIVQSLLVTCVLQGVDPYTYLVDVLQRIAIHPHPQARVQELTPSLWKQHFADAPLDARSR